MRDLNEIIRERDNRSLKLIVMVIDRRLLRILLIVSPSGEFDALRLEPFGD